MSFVQNKRLWPGKLICLFSMLFLFHFPLFAIYSTVPTSDLNKIKFDQKVGATIPLNLTFTDEQGQAVPLQTYFKKKPVILVPVYYNCPMLCTMTLNEVLHSLRAIRLNAGKDFQVVIFSINPREKPPLAKSKKDSYLTGYNRPGAANGWHFLTGEQPAITSLTSAIGFHYFYDSKTGQYGHPTGILVLTPQGKINRYFLGEEYSPRDLRLALIEASANKLGSVTDQITLFCCHYDPSTGRYSLAIFKIIRILGFLTVVILGAFIFIMVRREKKKKGV